MTSCYSKWLAVQTFSTRVDIYIRLPFLKCTYVHLQPKWKDRWVSCMRQRSVSRSSFCLGSSGTQWQLCGRMEVLLLSVRFQT